MKALKTAIWWIRRDLRLALGIAIVALFERRPWSYILVNGGYFVVAFTVMGAILGAWR